MERLILLSLFVLVLNSPKRSSVRLDEFESYLFSLATKLGQQDFAKSRNSMKERSCCDD